MKTSTQCPDCAEPRIVVVHEPLLDRRGFLQKTAAAAAALTLAPWAKADPSPASETTVQNFYKTLTEQQRKAMCFPFESKLRSMVDNNWHIVDQTVKAFYTNEQRQMIHDIFNGLHSAEYAAKVLEQVEHDSGKDGFEGSSVAVFGEPGTGKFEFVFTGRHCTRRCDGDSVEGAAFGGPIFYGHAAKSFNEEADHAGNVYWFQAKRANDVFQMLDGKQRQTALCERGREESGEDTVKLSGKKTGLEGLRVGEMSKDQQDEVRKVLKDLLAPFRPQDAAESMKLIEASGFDDLHMAFYKAGDIGKDGVWDVWQLEGPNMVWHFRGSPHVHVWANIRAAS